MRRPILLLLVLAPACAGTLYNRYAGPAAGTPDEVFACVQAQLKTLGYARKQYNETSRWFVAQKIMTDQNSSGLYRHTMEVLDTRVTSNNEGKASLEIKASSFDEFATARGEDVQEKKASTRVQVDARTLGQACS